MNFFCKICIEMHWCRVEIRVARVWHVVQAALYHPPCVSGALLPLISRWLFGAQPSGEKSRGGRGEGVGEEGGWSGGGGGWHGGGGHGPENMKNFKPAVQLRPLMRGGGRGTNQTTRQYVIIKNTKPLMKYSWKNNKPLFHGDRKCDGCFFIDFFSISV